MLYRLCGFYCCVAPANLNLMPNFYGWPNNVLVVPLPQVGEGGGSAIIEISGKEIKIRISKYILKHFLLRINFTTKILHNLSSWSVIKAHAQTFKKREYIIKQPMPSKLI